MYRLIIMFFVFNALNFFMFAQILKNPISKNSKTAIGKPGVSYFTKIEKDSAVSVENDPAKMESVIVEFREAPMFMRMHNNGAAKPDYFAYASVQLKFAADLSAIKERVENDRGVSINSPVKIREYYKLFNGAAYKIPNGMLNAVSSLGYVKRIYKNNPVKINLRESVHQIKADSVWSVYQNKGDSVVVGVIDTGIDYKHPALGGGFGKGFRIIGGYDCINNDADPMDDEGHGTHVAGIIAGNCDSIKGVAPNAFLYAVKVLDQYGNGSDGDVIAGIERAVDPNDDNDYSDKVDVMNLSLGGTGDPEDPVAKAIDNAVDLGVTCCIAAGNDGYWGSIGSPGCAKNAITAGACNKDNTWAGYSSCGPTNSAYSIKPDILAPGTDIFSSFQQGEYEVLSGTSMASPHVAGLCALLKRQHKEWSPAKIKSAVMTSAIDIGKPVMMQGAGIIDAMKAFAVTSFAFPSSLSFGIDTVNVGTWNISDTVLITNDLKTAQNYQVIIKSTQSGITLTANPSYFSAPAGASQKIVFTLKVAESIKPSSIADTNYTGTILINSENDKMRIPWAFIKTNILVAEFEYPVNNAFIFNMEPQINSYSPSVYFPNPYRLESVIQPGKYSMGIVQEGIKDSVIKNERTNIIFKENLALGGYTKLKISSLDAKYKFVFNAVDENGAPLKDDNNTEKGIAFVRSDKTSEYFARWIYNLNYLGSDIYFSEISPDFTILTGIIENPSSTVRTARIIQFNNLRGISGDVTLTNSPSDYLCENIKLNTSRYGAESLLEFVHRFYYKYNNTLYLNGFMRNSYPAGSSDWEGKLFINRQKNPDCGFTGDLGIYTKDFYTGYLGGLFMTKGDSVTLYPDIRSSTPQLFYKNNGQINFGDGIITIENRYYSVQTSKTFLFDFESACRGQSGESFIYNLNWLNISIYDDKNNKIYNNYGSPFFVVGVPAGKYFMSIIDTNGYISGIKGINSCKTEFILGEEIKYSPTLTAARVLNSEGSPVSHFNKGENGSLFLSAEDINDRQNIDASATKIFLRKCGAQDWIQVTSFTGKASDSLGCRATADISGYLTTDSSAYDMKIQIANNDSLKTEYLFTPAFIVGNYITEVEQEEGTDGATPKIFCLKNNYPNPFNPVTVIEYELPVKGRAVLKIFDVLGREVAALIDREEDAGKHKVDFDARKFASGVYIYRLTSGGFTDTKKMLLLK
jgi:subtilisin family serine protease